MKLQHSTIIPKFLVVLGVLVFLTNDCFSQQSVIAKWTFDSSSSDQKTFFDVTGHGYDASSTLPFSLTSGLKNKAIEFSSTGFECYVNNSKGNFEIPNFTIESWIYSYNGFGVNQYETNIFSYTVCGQPGTGISAGYGMLVRASDSLLLTALADSTQTWVATASKTKLKSNIWYHTVCTYDGSILKIYLNGILENSVAWTKGYTPCVNSPYALNAMIGHTVRAPHDVLSWFVGKMDELTLYNYAISADTILAHYNKLKPIDTPRVIAKWSFDSLSEDQSTFYDVTGNGFNAVSSLPLGVTEGLKGKALNCSKDSFDIQIPNSKDNFGVPNFTIEGWIYSYENLVTSGGWENYKKIFTFISPTGQSRPEGYQLELNFCGQLDMVMADKSGSTWVYAYVNADTIRPFRWYQVAGTYDGTNMKIYLNGKLLHTAANSGGYALPKNVARIGATIDPNSGQNGYWFNGKIDELTLYNYALSADSILSHYNKLKPIDTQKIIAKWTFDEIKNDSVYDVTGNGNNFKLINGPKISSGLKGNSLAFDGIDDYGSGANNPMQSGLKAMTIESIVWLNQLPSNNKWGTIINKWGPGSSEDDAWGLDIDRASPFGGHGVVAGQGTSCHINSKSTFPVGKWVHFVFSWDGQKEYLYLNGQKTDSNSTASMGLMQSVVAPLWLGINAVNDMFNGKIDEITLYNYALPADTILAHSKIISIDPPRIVAKWTFDEMKNDSIYDVTGNGNNLKMSGGVTLVQGIKGNAATFDGIDDMGLAANNSSQSGMNALTIETVAWISQYPSNNDYSVILDKYGPGSSGDDAYAFSIDKKAPFGIAGWVIVNGGIQNNVISKTSPSLGKWVHLAYVWTGLKNYLYYNGIKTDSSDMSAPGPMQSVVAQLSVGAFEGGLQFFNGKLDELTIYNYALSADTILAHYNALKPPTSEINIGIKKQYAKPSDDVWVPVYITNFKKDYTISSLHFTLDIDTTIATFETAIKDSGIVNNWDLIFNGFKKDSVIFSMAGLQHPLGYGEGELFRCLFKVKPSIGADTVCDLIIRNLKIDDGIDSVVVTSTTGKIIISKPTIVYGDVSGNNDVTAFDAAGIIQYVVGQLQLPDPKFPNFTLKIADVSGDTSISSYDAALVMQYSVGLLLKFPVEQKYRLFEQRGDRKPRFPNSTLRLQKSPKSTDKIAVFDLYGINLSGAISTDIRLKYNPDKILVNQNGSISPIIHGKLVSSIDSVNKHIVISFTTTDDIDDAKETRLITIEVPVTDTVDISRNLFFFSAKVDEETVENLLPVINTNINSLNGSILLTNRIINRGVYGIMILNYEKTPVTFSLFDLKGRKIFTKQYQPADQIIAIKTRSFASGIYIYSLKMGKKQLVNQLYISR